MKRNTIILKYFIQFTCTNLGGSKNKGGHFLNLLQKEGVSRKKGFPQKGGGRSQPWKKLCKCFQYKVLNAFFLNKKLCLFNKSNLPLCSFCKEEDETVFVLYFYCTNVRNLWTQLNFYLA